MYQLKYFAPFKRSLKKLAKKYPRIRNDISGLFDQLEQGNLQGDELQGFSGKVYKVRAGSTDQKRGKRGGFRVIYYVVTQDGIIYLAYIYAKSQQEELTHQQKQEIKELIQTLH